MGLVKTLLYITLAVSAAFTIYIVIRSRRPLLCTDCSHRLTFVAQVHRYPGGRTYFFHCEACDRAFRQRGGYFALTDADPDYVRKLLARDETADG